MELKLAAILLSLIAFSCISSSTSCDPAEFEKMDVDGLVEQNDTSLDCMYAAANVFERKFAHKVIRIQKFAPFRPKAEFVHVPIEKAPNTLRLFGHLMQRLYIGAAHYGAYGCNSSELAQFTEILHSVNLHCSKTLRELDFNFDRCAVNIFDEIRGPFEKLENLKIEFTTTKLVTDNVTLNQVFPQMKKIDLQLHKGVTSAEFMDQQYPYMEQFVSTNWLFDGETMPKFENFTKKNPQIKAVKFSYPPRSSLRCMSEHLPNLEEIRIHRSAEENTDTDNIHFKNVRVVEFLDASCSSMANVTFEDLNEVTVDHGCRSHDFILKQKNIQRLKLITFINDSTVRNYTGIFPHLAEASFSFNDDVSPVTMAQFISNSKELKELRCFFLNDKQDEYMGELQSKLGAQFDINCSRNQFTNKCMQFSFSYKNTVPA